MSEPLDQPVAEAPVAEAPAGVEAAAPAVAPTDDDIDTDAFDRVEAPEEAAEPAPGEDGEPIPAKPTAAEDETVEVEIGGKKYTVPKAIEGDLLRQADYTRKTQDLAEQRRQIDAQAETLDADRAKQAESLTAFRAEHLTVASQEAALEQIETELAGYRQYTLAAWEKTKAENPALYQQHAERLEFLRLQRTISTDALEAARKDLTTKEASLAERQTAAEKARLNDNWSKANEVLAKDLPDWTPPWQPGKGQEIAAFVNKEFGITAEQIRTSTDPTAWKMANALMEARAMIAKLEANQKQSTATTTALKAQTVTPAAKPAGAGAKPAGVRDELSGEEWLRRRNAQVAKRNRG